MDYVLEKGFRTHKYVKRTGSPGNYKYWYKMPDGSIQSPDDAQHQGKVDHAKRLLLGKDRGHHSMDARAIAAHVGLDHDKVQSAKRNLARHGTEWRGRTFSHGYEDHHVAEGHAEAASHEGTSHESPEQREHRLASAREALRPASPAPAPRRRRESSGARRSREDAESIRTERRKRDRAESAPSTRPDTPRSDEAKNASRGYTLNEREELERAGFTITTRLDGYNIVWKRDSVYTSTAMERIGGSHGEPSIWALTIKRFGHDDQRTHHLDFEQALRIAKRTFEEDTARENTARMRELEAEGATTSDAQGVVEAEQMSAQAEAERKRARLRELGVNLGSAPTPAAPVKKPASSRERAAQAAEAVRSASLASPSSPAAAEIHAACPDLAAADAPISRMEEAAARGENPYLHRATEIFHNIMSDLKPERRDVCKHVLQAIADLKAGNAPLNEANIVDRYKHLSGKKIRVISGIAKEFEKGTFMTLQEVMDNKPVDPEIERMKRGYGAKQYARIKPFLKTSWTDANPGAPPPMPTFGDVKSWSEHGGPKPEWAGTTRMALPKDVFDANHKASNGKVKYPPPWMPIHMMPVWIYTAKSMQKKMGDEAWTPGNDGKTPAYAAVKTPQASQASPTGWNVGMGNQSSSRSEGMIVNAMRKYIQMRGGVHQLNDIPSHKLDEVGLTHSDIFKAANYADLSDASIKKLIRHKIVDPVALVPFLKKEIKAGSVKKSFSLVVSQDVAPVTFKKSFVVSMSKEEIKKAELIAKIRALKAARG